MIKRLDLGSAFALAAGLIVAFLLAPGTSLAQGRTLEGCLADGNISASECERIYGGRSDGAGDGGGVPIEFYIAIGGGLFLLAAAAVFYWRRIRRTGLHEDATARDEAPSKPVAAPVEKPAAAATADRVPRPAGWYPNPGAEGLRYWDGANWTSSYHPGSRDTATVKELLWALSLGFGATGGVVGLLSIPVLAFYFPLGFGTAGAALAVAAMTREGETPWYATIAVIASLAALGLGISAYNEFQDAQRGLDILTP